MLTAVDRLGVDAAIIFADLLPILEPLGFQLEFAEGEGPVIHNPLREASDLDRVRPLEDVGALEFVMETVRLTRAGLPAHIPVIGFAGCPFTLASYAIEGGASRQYLHTKSADVSRRRRLARVDEPAGPRRHAVSQRPDRGRRRSRATVRQLGRHARARRLSPLGLALHRRR